MGFSPKSSLAASSWQELTLLKSPDLERLDSIKAHLDLILLSLEAISASPRHGAIAFDSNSILQAARELSLESTIAELELWQLPQSNSLQIDSPEQKKLNLDQVRSLVLIIAYLAKQHQELLRRAVSLLEQVTEQNQEPDHITLLGDYINKFIEISQARMIPNQLTTSVTLHQLALKLLIDLLFYSGNNGHRLLWLTIL